MVENSIAAALRTWVENGKAPERLSSERANWIGGLMGMPEAGPAKHLLTYAYPNHDVLRPGMDPDEASSYYPYIRVHP
jgi:hypothetical protein